MSRVLCVDDEPAILRLLGVVLAVDKHVVVAVGTAREALAVMERGEVDLVLLDLGLPDRDGIELLVQIKAVAQVPVIVVSARQNVSERVTALDLGATDYVTKPFDADELRARIRAALRQASTPLTTGKPLAYGTISLRPDRHEAEKSGKALSLTPREYAVLQALVEAGGRILTHAALLERVWGKAHRNDVEYLRVVIRALRLKIEDDPSQPTFIRNEPGIGYRLS